MYLAGNMAQEKWYSDIYQKREHQDLDYWKRIKHLVLDRDHFRCKACFHRKKYESLSVHHTVPRCEGGQDDIDNLITLCISCHDIIEETDIRCESEIIGYCTAERKKNRKYQNLCDHDDILQRIDARRPSWHARVYGGER